MEIGYSDNTRKTIWKYLQLILFTVISDIKSSDTFDNAIGDSSQFLRHK